MAMLFKPLSAGGVAMRKYAARLAAQVGMAGSSGATQFINGYMLRAVRNGADVIVYVIDPAAVWAFLHHDTVAGFGAHLKLAARAFSREILSPGVTPVVSEPVAKALDTALLPFAPGQGYYPTIDAGALFIPTTVPTTPHIYPDVVSTCVLARTSGNVQATFATDRFQVWADSFVTKQPKWHAPGADTSEFIAYYHRMYAWLMPESGLATVTGDADARFYTRQSSRYSYSIPAFAAQCVRNGIASPVGTARWRSDPIVAGAYVSQPDGSDAPGGDPATDPARYGVAGLFITRLRRPEAPIANSYPLAHLYSFSLLMTSNPEPELVPVLVDVSGVNRYATHGVSGVGLCYTMTPAELTDPDEEIGPRGTIHLFATLHCRQGATTWTALQLASIDPMGVATQATLYKGNAAKGHLVGPEIEMFEVGGIVGASYDIVAGKVDQASVDLLHFGVDGVIRTTGLRGAGWYVFTQYLLNTISLTTGSLYGQASLYAADIGDNKVAVLARDYVVGSSDSTADWTLVVVDKISGAFIEARGLVGAASVLTYNAHITVITPESTVDDVTRPAVLLCTLGTTHRLSTDGGLSWVVVFTGFTGAPLYCGNQLYRLNFGVEK